MNPDYVQNLRYKLQKRMRRVNGADYSAFPRELMYFTQFIEGNQALRGIVDSLTVQYPDVSREFENARERSSGYLGDSETEHAALAYFLIRRWAFTDNDNLWLQDGFHYGMRSQHDETADMLKRLFVEPLYDYIDEQLDDSRAILSLLMRYKHRCEWFKRAHLRQLVENNTQSGERHLALDLYEYLHDLGVSFHIEPYSASGIPDLVADQQTDDPLIADAKIFDPSRSKGRSYLVKGFNQIYTYTRDFNEPFGYLVIYRTCTDDVKFDVSGTNMSVPFVTHNGKTIFLLVIDIAEYEASASKRGQLKCYTITEDMLIGAVEETSDSAPIAVEVDQHDIAVDEGVDNELRASEAG